MKRAWNEARPLDRRALLCVRGKVASNPTSRIRMIDALNVH